MLQPLHEITASAGNSRPARRSPRFVALYIITIIYYVNNILLYIITITVQFTILYCWYWRIISYFYYFRRDPNGSSGNSRDDTPIVLYPAAAVGYIRDAPTGCSSGSCPSSAGGPSRSKTSCKTSARPASRPAIRPTASISPRGELYITQYRYYKYVPIRAGGCRTVRILLKRDRVFGQKEFQNRFACRYVWESRER